jgi:hypothetical protein
MKSLVAMAVAITAFSCFLPIKVHADTYQVIFVANDNYSRPYGIDGSGTVVLEWLGPNCFSPSNICYYTTADPTLLDTPPPITDNGGPAGPGCPALPAFTHPPNFYLCNNGHEAFGLASAFSWPGGVGPSGVFDGPDPIANFIYGGNPASGGFDPALMNSSGDFVFDEGFGDLILEGIDLTSRQTAFTPEPGSLTLFATGALVTAGAMRRRWRCRAWS